MSTLHDRLAYVADASTAGPPPTGLWEQGRRVHRRRRAGTVAIVAAAVVLLAGVVSLDRSQSSVDIAPAGPTSKLGLPDRLFLPDPHLAGTDDTGPIGPLSVAFPAIRESWTGDSSNGLVGVSATGEYAFLDLPGSSPTDIYSNLTDFALSADGTRVAYWLTGDPSGEPGGDPQLEPYVGVAVYDTVTGEVWRRPITTKHGVRPTQLVWAGATLWFEVWQYDPPDGNGSASSGLQDVITWEPESGRKVVVDDKRLGAHLSSASVYEGDLVWVDRGGRVRRIGPDGEETVDRRQLTSTPQGPVFISPEGTSIAGLRAAEGDGDASGLPEPVVVGSLVDTTPVVLSEVPDADTRGLEVLLGWRDERHVVGLRIAGRESFRGVVSIDVVTGELERLLPFTINVGVFVIAQDALTGPVFEAPRPPEPLDPRLTYGGAAAIVLVAGAALLWWRRRVQR